MGAPLYEHSEEIIDIIKLLFSEREDLYGEMKKRIYPEMFAAGLRYDKQAPAKIKSYLKIDGVKGAKTILNQDKKWLIHGFKDSWNSCDKAKKIAIVANILMRVKFPTDEELEKLEEKGQDYEFGQLASPDIQDFSAFLKAFGIDWCDSKVIPDLTTDKDLEI